MGKVLVKMGIYFQAQDDFLDWYATPEELGKIGTDIQDKKCSWLFVHAYHDLASPQQKAVLDSHYGKCTVGSDEELQIKSLYRDLNLDRHFREYEENSYREIMSTRSEVEAAG